MDNRRCAWSDKVVLRRIKTRILGSSRDSPHYCMNFLIKEIQGHLSRRIRGLQSELLSQAGLLVSRILP